MTKRYTFAIEQRDMHITSLRIACAALAILALCMWIGWREAPKQMTVHLPADLTEAVTLRAEEVPPTAVYSFAAYIFQVLQHWEEDGNKNYPENIYSLQNFTTPKYQAWLLNDFEQRSTRGETRGRRRIATPIPGQGYTSTSVRQLSAGSWLVVLNYETTEYQNGVEVKRAQISWPLRVVRYDVDREANPWGLALDGFQPGMAPERLDSTQLAEANR